jgi:prolipoprotein diacylglyceryltransferase
MRQILIDLGQWELFGADVGLRIFGYGLMLVLGFISAILLAQWRARRAGEDPEMISMAGIVALVAGVLGARLAYVIENWDSQFAHSDNLLLDMINITSGGLIYYGGLLLATAAVLIFFGIKKLPLRRYMDLVAPSLMVGLAFGRMGCLLNGCCFGAVCDGHSALSMEFPMYSRPLLKLDGREKPFSSATRGPTPPYAHQLEEGRISPDPHLLQPGSSRMLVPVDELHGLLERDQLGFMSQTPEQWKQGFSEVAGADALVDRKDWDKALKEGIGPLAGSEKWSFAMISDQNRDGRLDREEFVNYLGRRRDWLLAEFDITFDRKLTEVERTNAQAYLQKDELALAMQAHSLPVKPAQVLGIVNALLLAGLLGLFFRRRRREGQVFALLLVLYPITRFFLELIRSDNPHNLLRLQLTHNQWTSLAMILAGGLILLGLWKMNPSAGPTANQRGAALEAAPAPANPGNKRRRK